MNHVAMSRLEINAVDEIAIDRPPLAKVRRTAKEGHLRSARLDRQGAARRACQPGRPRTGGQDYRLAFETSLVRFHACDSTAFLYDRLDLDPFANIRPIASGGIGEG